MSNRHEEMSDDLTRETLSELVRRGEDCISNIDEPEQDAAYWSGRAVAILREVARRSDYERELVAARTVIAEVDEYLDAIQKPDYKSLQFAVNGIAKTLAQSHADVLKAVRKEAWDEGWDRGNEHATSDWFVQATRKEANPYRA